MFPPKYQLPLMPREIAPTLKLDSGVRAQAAASGSRANASASSSSPDSRFSKETCSAVSMAGKCASARTGARADCKLSASWAKAV